MQEALCSVQGGWEARGREKMKRNKKGRVERRGKGDFALSPESCLGTGAQGLRMVGRSFSNLTTSPALLPCLDRKSVV